MIRNFSRWAAIWLACVPLSMPFASQGWKLGPTGLGFGFHYLDDQVPDALGPDRSRPWGLELSQEFYSGHGFRAGLYGDAAWEEEQESCFFICMDYNMIGRYFWNTRYAAAGLRFSPDGFGFLDHFGLDLGYSLFQYHWGIAKRGWDSPYPSGYFLSGKYTSHQAVLGLDYEIPFRIKGLGFAVKAGVAKTLASYNTFTPLMLRNDTPREFDFPERPLGMSLSLKWEF
jgi:hypothetical protein